VRTTKVFAKRKPEVEPPPDPPAGAMISADLPYGVSAAMRNPI
jgi:hypothetical protein